MGNEKTLATRNYGIDMLRILCMFFVCFLHVLGRGGILEACVAPSFKHTVIWFFEIAAYGAVNTYALNIGPRQGMFAKRVPVKEKVRLLV